MFLNPLTESDAFGDYGQTSQKDFRLSHLIRST